MNKEQFLRTLRDEQAAWEQFLAGIPADQRERPGACGHWSVTDVVGHVAAWERFVTARVRAQMRNGKAAPHEVWGEFIPDSSLRDDALNEWMAAQISGRSFEQMLGMQREVRSQLLGTVQAMSEHFLSAPEVVVEGLPWKKEKPLWEVIASMSYHHINEHTDSLKEHFDHE